MKDRAIPLVAQGNADCMAKRLRGTANEVWVKLLKIKYKHRAMPVDDWMAAINAEKNVKAEAYK